MSGRSFAPSSASALPARFQSYTTGDVAALLGVSASTALRWVRDGELASYVTPGGHHRVPVEALAEFAARTGMPVAASEIAVLVSNQASAAVVANDVPASSDPVPAQSHLTTPRAPRRGRKSAAKRAADRRL